jgi:hypothetical protein
MKSILRGFTKKDNSQGESLAKIYLAKQDKVGRFRGESREAQSVPGIFVPSGLGGFQLKPLPRHRDT